MCGIVGVASPNISKAELEVFADLLTVSTFRGRDSVGTAMMKEEKNKKEKPTLRLRMYKEAGDIYQTLRNNEEKLFKHYNTAGAAKVAIGHTRAATRGLASEVKNAHPFMTENFIGVHNGTINTFPLDETDKFACDSETLLTNMDRHGVYETFDKLQAHDWNAYTVVWMDKRDMSLNFIRNSKRPLWFCYLKKGHTLFWASEKGMLEFTLSRLDDKFDFEKPWELPVDTHVKFLMKKRWPFSLMSEDAKDGGAIFTKQEWKTKPRTYMGNYVGDNSHRNVIWPAKDGDIRYHWERGSKWREVYNEKEKKWIRDDKETPLTYFGEEERKPVPLLPAPQNTKTGSSDTEPSGVATTTTKDKPVILHPTGTQVSLRQDTTNGESRFVINAGGSTHDYSEAVYDSKLRKGCAWCSQQALLHEDVRWIDQDTFLCDPCANVGTLLAH